MSGWWRRTALCKVHIVVTALKKGLIRRWISSPLIVKRQFLKLFLMLYCKVITIYDTSFQGEVSARLAAAYIYSTAKPKSLAVAKNILS